MHIFHYARRSRFHRWPNDTKNEWSSKSVVHKSVVDMNDFASLHIRCISERKCLNGQIIPFLTFLFRKMDLALFQYYFRLVSCGHFLGPFKAIHWFVLDPMYKAYFSSYHKHFYFISNLHFNPLLANFRTNFICVSSAFRNKYLTGQIIWIFLNF